MSRKANITEEDFNYTKERLEELINEILKISNESNIRMFEKHNTAIQYYTDSIIEIIDKYIKDNSLSLDINIKILGSRTVKYYKSVLRVVLNRLLSRLDERSEYDDDNLLKYMEYINSFIFKISSDYDIDIKNNTY